MTHSYSADIEAAKSALITKYSTVKPEWNALIRLADEQFMLLDDINREIDTIGLIDQKTLKKNPLIASKKDIITSLLKIYQQLGLSPWSESKIKTADTAEDTDLLKKIMGD